jgi:hypothetical protein
MTPEAYDHLDRLLTQIAVLKGIRDGSVDAVNETRIYRSLFATADDLRVARAKPMTEVATAWTDWNARNTFKPGVSL